MNKRIRTDYLFAQPSFLSGAARVFDLWGHLDSYNSSNSAAEADAKAIASDWAVIGQDMYDAIEQFDAAHKTA